MEYIVIIITLIALVVLRIILGTSKKQLKEFIENEELNKITNSLPSNIEIAKNISSSLNNENVNIKEDDSKITLYMIFNNTISISKGENNYTRIQTIAHECIHSTQNKKMLWFNYIFSNIYLIYFIIISILTILNKSVNYITNNSTSNKQYSNIFSKKLLRNRCNDKSKIYSKRIFG